MNLVKSDGFNNLYICPICQEIINKDDKICLIRHYDEKKRIENDVITQKKKHIVHVKCINEYNDYQCKMNSEMICPLDRLKLHSIIYINFGDIFPINLIHYSDNYYKLLDHIDNQYVSFTDDTNLNYRDDKGRTLFYCACQRGYLKIVRQLYKLGANATLTDYNGFSPLMASASNNYLKIVKFLLTINDVVGNINHTDNIGNTAIKYAYDNHYYQIVIELLSTKQITSDYLAKLFAKIQYVHFSDMYMICIRNMIAKLLNVPKIKNYKHLILMKKTKIIYHSTKNDNSYGIFNAPYEQYKELYQPQNNLI